MKSFALALLICISIKSICTQRETKKNSLKKVINISQDIKHKVNKIEEILSGKEEREALCLVGNKCGLCNCCIGPCINIGIGDVCVGACTGIFGNADDVNSKALNGPVAGAVSDPNSIEDGDCLVGGSCGDCQCCFGQCAIINGEQICIGQCFNIFGIIQYSREKLDGDLIAPAEDNKCVGNKCGDCDCCIGFCFAGKCFGACAKSDGSEILSFNAVIAPGDVGDVGTTTSVGIGAPCGSCPNCLGICVFDHCIGTCVGENRQLNSVISPEFVAFGASTFTIKNGRNHVMNYSVTATFKDFSGTVPANGISTHYINIFALIRKVRAVQQDNSGVVCEYTSSGTGYRTFAICDAVNNGCKVCRPGQSGCCM